MWSTSEFCDAQWALVAFRKAIQMQTPLHFPRICVSANISATQEKYKCELFMIYCNIFTNISFHFHEYIASAVAKTIRWTQSDNNPTPLRNFHIPMLILYHYSPYKKGESQVHMRVRVYPFFLHILYWYSRLMITTGWIVFSAWNALGILKVNLLLHTILCDLQSILGWSMSVVKMFQIR